MLACPQGLPGRRPARCSPEASGLPAHPSVPGAPGSSGNMGSPPGPSLLGSAALSPRGLLTNYAPPAPGAFPPPPPCGDAAAQGQGRGRGSGAPDAGTGSGHTQSSARPVFRERTVSRGRLVFRVSLCGRAATETRNVPGHPESRAGECGLRRRGETVAGRRGSPRVGPQLTADQPRAEGDAGQPPVWGRGREPRFLRSEQRTPPPVTLRGLRTLPAEAHALGGGVPMGAPPK